MVWQGFEFTADFPDDGIEQGEGDDWRVVRPNGMALANIIADLFRKAGMDVGILEPDIEHYSWNMPTEYKGRYYWVQLSDLGKSKVVLTEGSSPLFKNLFKRRDFYEDFLQDVRRLLDSHPKLGPVKWHHTDRHGNPRPLK